MAKYTKEFLLSLTSKQFDYFFDSKRFELAGGAVFIKNNSLISKLIVNVTKKYSKGDFVPSHVGSIIFCRGKLNLFNMMPPIGGIVDLKEWVKSTDDDFVLLTRDFELDIDAFSKEIFTHVGERYGYFSALQSGFKGISWVPNRKRHCSEIHSLALQKQGWFKGLKCDDVTPVELYDILYTSERVNQYYG